MEGFGTKVGSWRFRVEGVGSNHRALTCARQISGLVFEVKGKSLGLASLLQSRNTDPENRSYYGLERNPLGSVACFKGCLSWLMGFRFLLAETSSSL